MNDALIVRLLSIVPRRGASRLQGAFARAGLSRTLLNWYVRHFDVDTEEMVGSLDDYASLSQFFVRPLKEGERPVDGGADSLVSPCDGKAVAFGDVKGGAIAMPDGQPLSVGALLEREGAFEGGRYVVIYLAPHNYHRVHSPVDGAVRGFSYMPGHLWPVFPAAVRAVEQLFAKNERLSMAIERTGGRELSLLMVGAYGVGRIETTFSELLTNAGEKACSERFDEGRAYGRGDEVGRFNLGSTVIMLFEAGEVEFEMELDQEVRMGERIGRLL